MTLAVMTKSTGSLSCRGVGVLEHDPGRDAASDRNQEELEDGEHVRNLGGEGEGDHGRLLAGRAVLGNRFQFLNSFPKYHGCVHQVRDQLFTEIKMSFVFTPITQAMTMRQYLPHLRPQTERMRKALEYDISTIGTIAVPAQSSQSEGMRRIVGEIKSAFERKGSVLGIVQSGAG